MQRLRRHPSLRSRAVQELREAIVIGTLPAGSLHSEQSIAAKLGLSRTPIREALLQLMGEGLVTFVPNKGARVAELNTEHLAYVLQFRAAIEGCGASRLASGGNKALLDRLETELKRQRSVIKAGDRLEWVEANMDFHTIFAEACDNRLMLEAFAPLASHTKRLGYRMNYRAQRMRESLDEHSAVVDAIRRGDADRARTMAEEHLYITTVLMKQLFADIGIPDGAETSGLKKKRGRNAK